MNTAYSDEMKLRQLYERYKLQWMIDHGFTLADLIACMEGMISEDLSGSEVHTNLQSLFADWEYGVGFEGGSIWPCFAEYLQLDANGGNTTGKFLLISVFEREIVSEPFANFQEAHRQMMTELKTEFCKDSSEAEWESIESLDSYSCDDFGFSEKTAWSNLDDDCSCDWLIVETT